MSLLKRWVQVDLWRSIQRYSNIMELADALLQGQIDAAIMKTSSIEMIDEMGDFTGFASDVKLIYSGEFYN